MLNRTVAFVAFVAALAFVVPAMRSAPDAPKPAGEFASTTIDLGVVVSDINRSAKFYTEALGFKEVKGFSAPGDFLVSTGLTNGAPLKIRVFVLGDGDAATKIKLMEVPEVISRRSDNAYIHSQLGFRYLTIFVSNTNAALARLQKTGDRPIGRGGAVPLPKGFPEGVFLTCVRDPDGNIIELIGPKK